MRQYCAEFLGTFFLMFAVIFSGDAWTVGLILAAMIYVAGHISGGHFNPAISLAAYLRGVLTAPHLVLYTVVQIAGAYVGAAYYWMQTGFERHFVVSVPFNSLMYDVIIREILFTGLLCLVFLTVATTVKFRSSMVNGLVIGLTVAAISSIGGSFNPALYLGSVICNATGALMPSMFYLVTFAIAPLIGSLLAFMTFKHLNPSEL